MCREAHPEGGTTGVSRIQWLLQVAPTVVSPQRVLLQPPSGSKPQSPTKVGMPPPAVILGTPVVPAEGGTTGVSGIQWLLQVAPTVVSPQRVLLQPPSGSKKVGIPPPAVILGTPVVHAEGGTTGVSGIQWLLQVAPTVVSPQRVLLQPPSGLKKAGMPPPAVILGTPVVHAEGGTTGVSGIQWLLQVAPSVVSPQRVLLQPPSESKKVGIPPPAVRIKAGGDAPPAVRIKAGGDAPSRRQDQRRRGSSKKEYCFQPVIVRLVPGGSRNLFSPVNPC